ncbi:hypothetical protein ACFU99_28810 [Streptomyces sp. NPDC057654]|uniref:hypothetical protein n=1 Tax=Streptomyces sp. NPDC057654 TaxID=3346196 RepID=UPI003690972F
MVLIVLIIGAVFAHVLVLRGRPMRERAALFASACVFYVFFSNEDIAVAVRHVVQTVGGG